MASIPPSASTTAAAAAASTMQTVTLSLFTHASLSPARPTLTQALSSLATPSISAANAATTGLPPPSDQDFDMGSLPWPPLWLTVCAFALTLVATVMGVGVWLISSPPRYAGCDGDCVCGCEEDEGEEKEWWEGKRDEEELEEEWDSGDDEHEGDGAVELKRLLSDAPSKLNDNRRADAVAKRNSKNLRLDLTAAAGLGVGSWGRGDAGYDGINDDVDDVWERKCRDYGVERHQHGGEDDDTASLVSLSLASCSSSSSSCTANRIHNANTPSARRSAASTSTKPVFNQPLHGWRKAVDDRVCALACWIEAYVADGGREKDLLCKITREERGDVVYGFEY
ncbi:uncharacterized protein J3D65DRAFT_599678 [Phyllosticta citribraziliensis]|uniref:Uncharacterized protein n=1 Tax=Phyllosticta citribraziliensis TaxID=989973 RepID=A0ABR1MES1_9PEZI